MFAAWLAAPLVAGLSAQAGDAIELSRTAIGAPHAVCELDLTVLKGEVRRLSWAPNGESLHLQTRDPRNGNLFDYIVDLGSGELSLAFGEPAWSPEYWSRKSALAAPGLPALRLEVLESNRRTRPAPFTGPLNGGAGQTPDPRNPVDAYENEVALWFAGVEIGNWINGAPMAGETFGWGPDGSGVLAFTDRRGQVVLIDRARRRMTAAGVRDAIFPAWSPDGRRIAWIQKAGRKKFRLLFAPITTIS